MPLLPVTVSKPVSRRKRGSTPQPSSADVPTVPLRRDPGLNVPSGAFESFGGVIGELSEPFRKAAEKMQSRQDGIEFSRGVVDYADQAGDEVKKFNLERDLSDGDTAEELGGRLTEIRNQALANFKGSVDAQAKLDARLIGIQSVLEGQAGEIGAAISLERADEALDGALGPIIDQAHQSASTLGFNDRGVIDLQIDINQSFITWDTRIDDLRGVYNPTQENNLRKSGRTRIAERVLTTLISRGNVDVAEQLLSTGISESFTPEQKQVVIQKIADVRASRTSMLRKIQEAEIILGRPLNVQERAQLIGLKESKESIAATKEVLNLSTGQLQFATDEQIAADPNLVPKDVGAKDEDKITGQQSVSAGFALRMKQSMNVIDEVGKQFTGVESRISGAELFPQRLKSEDRQRFEQAERNFVNALLRRESGAKIGEDEFKSAIEQYFPRPGDGDEVLEQKKQNRITAQKSMELEAGPAFTKLTESLPGLTVNINGRELFVGSIVINSRGQKGKVEQDGSITILED